MTHRAVDATAGLPAGSTSNLFRSRDTLLAGVVERFAERERANWDDLALRMAPRTLAALADALGVYVTESTRQHRTLTMARYAILVEAAHRPALRKHLLEGGNRVAQWTQNWLRAVGSLDPERDAGFLLNYASGLVLHELAVPAPAFDPRPRLLDLLAELIPAQRLSSSSLQV